MNRRHWLIPLLTLLLLLGTAHSQERYPGEHWQEYSSPEEAGWSSDRLAETKKYAQEIGSAGVLVIYDGAILLHWGEIGRRFMCHSIRKSFLSALYGIAVNRDEIDLHSTMGELGIQDDPPLTEQEKAAEVIHLLKARSGIYHSAAYETESMAARRPVRGSHPPGTTGTITTRMDPDRVERTRRIFAGYALLTIALSITAEGIRGRGWDPDRVVIFSATTSGNPEGNGRFLLDPDRVQSK